MDREVTRSSPYERDIETRIARPRLASQAPSVRITNKRKALG